MTTTVDLSRDMSGLVSSVRRMRPGGKHLTGDDLPSLAAIAVECTKRTIYVYEEWGT